MWMVTGGNGKLGRGIVEQLLRLVPAEQVVVGVRDPRSAYDLVETWVVVRPADFEDAIAMRTAFEGVERLLLVSTSGMPHETRFQHHQSAIEAATRSGVKEIVYTSLIVTAPEAVGRVHWQTEEVLAASGARVTALRHAFYLDNFVDGLLGESSIEVVCDGPINAALRADLAEAAARVLADDDRREVYDFTGPSAWRMSELAAEVAAVTGEPVPFTILDEETFLRQLALEGVPEFLRQILLDIQHTIRDGGFGHVSPDLPEVLGRPPVSMADRVRELWGAPPADR